MGNSSKSLSRFLQRLGGVSSRKNGCGRSSLSLSLPVGMYRGGGVLFFFFFSFFLSFFPSFSGHFGRSGDFGTGNRYWRNFPLWFPSQRGVYGEGLGCEILVRSRLVSNSSIFRMVGRCGMRAHTHTPGKRKKKRLDDALA